MRLHAAMLCTGIVLSGCASFTGPLSERKAGESPRLGEVTERSVGDVLYEVYDYHEMQGVSVPETIELGHMGGRGSIVQGTPLLAYEQNGATVYCTADAVYRMALQLRPAWRVCLTSKTHKDLLDSWEMMRTDAGWLNLQHPVAYSPAKTMAAGNGFRWELLYEGVSGNTVGILYREYIGDLLRPGFQQDLKYTLADSGPTEIRFRVARLRILSADNNGIKYEIMSGLRGK
jgi:hypothetical protein